ncbi:MAG: hypothetical protein ABEK04_00860 [Candidatus Nanohalobium sp.]
MVADILRPSPEESFDSASSGVLSLYYGEKYLPGLYFLEVFVEVTKLKSSTSYIVYVIHAAEQAPWCSGQS